MTIRAERKGSTDLLEHASARGDLLDDVLIKDCLRQHGQCLVLALDAELLCLHVDIDVVNLAYPARLVLRSLEDPAPEVIVSAVSRAFAFVVAILKDKVLLELIRKLFRTRLHGGFGGVDGPDIIFGGGVGIKVLDFSVDFAGEFVVTVGFEGEITIFGVGVVGVTVTRRVPVPVPVGFGFVVTRTFFGLGAARLFVGLVLLAFLGLTLDDEGAQLEASINIGALTAGFAIQQDIAVLDLDVGLGIFTFLAKHEFGDEAIEVVLELGGLVRTVDDPAIVCWIIVGLSPKLETKIFNNIGRWPTQGRGDAAEVDNDGLDAVALAFHLGLQTLHLVAIEGIRNILLDSLVTDPHTSDPWEDTNPANIDGSHIDGQITHSNLDNTLFRR